MLYLDERLSDTRRNELLREAQDERKALAAYANGQQKLSRRLIKSLRNLASFLGVL